MDQRNERLVYDIGMNNGDDTAFYLKKGFAVVAVEANPSLARAARDRFADAIATDQLHILNCALCETTTSIPFFINRDNDHLSSIDPGWAARNEGRCERIDVEGTTLRTLFARFGSPYYMKIDIEGADILALQQLADEDVKPDFVSVEDCRFGPDYVTLLAQMGYRFFKLLDQSTVPTLRDEPTGHVFPIASSGPFGPDLPGSWLPAPDFLQSYHATVRDLAGKRLAPASQWWDIHAARSDALPCSMAA